MIRFTLLGIPVRIEPWFWLTMAIVGGGSSANSTGAILRLAVFVLAGFVSILVHELGHALTGRAFGAGTAITLQAFGGYAEFPGNHFTRAQHFLVTAAGPLVQILLGVVAILLMPGAAGMQSDAGYFLRCLGIISIFWAVLNLLPVLPLDGGQMLNALLGPSRIKLTLWVSILTAIGAGGLMFLKTGSFLFPLFLAMFAYQSWKGLRGMGGAIRPA